MHDRWVLQTTGIDPSTYGSAGSSAAASPVPNADVSASLPAGPPGAPTPKTELTALVKRIAPAIAANPARKQSLLKLANDANASLRAGDDASTLAAIQALRQALPIDPASLPPGPLGRADYDAVSTRNKHLAGKYDPDSWGDRALNTVTGAMDDPANVLTDAERAEHLALNGKIVDTIFPRPTPDEARLDAMLASPLGTVASVATRAFGGSQPAQDAALNLGTAAEGIGMAFAGPRAGPATRFLGAQTGATAVPAAVPRSARSVEQESIQVDAVVARPGPIAPERQVDRRPTRRDGVLGGRPRGAPEPIPANANARTKEGHRLQQQSQDAMAAAGYEVELQPDVRPEDGTDPDKKPDMRLGGNIADAVSPMSSNVDQVRKAISSKVGSQQAFHIILNLGRTDVTREQISSLLTRKPIQGLVELFIHEKNGAITRILPQPEQITSPRE